MKTKRIVALALATAIAVGGVTPAFADNGHATKFEEQEYLNYSRKFDHALSAQGKEMNKAAKAYEKATADREAATADRQAKETVKAQKKGAVDGQQLVINQIAKEQEKLAKAAADNELAIAKKESEFVKNPANKDWKETAKGSKQAYIDAIEDLNNQETAILQHYGYSAEATTTDEYLNLEKELQKERTLFKLYENIGLQALHDKRDGYAEDSFELDKKMQAAKDKKSMADLELYNATQDFNAAQKKEAKAIYDESEARRKADKEESKYTRLATMGELLTMEYIEQNIAPKYGHLAVEDVMAYVFGSLAKDRYYFTEEVYKAAGLPDNIIKGYLDVLADGGELEDPDESKDESKTEDPKEPEKPTEESKTNPDENKKPVNPEKPAEESKTDKKEDKKNVQSKKNPKTGDIALLTYATSAVLAAGAFVASKKRK